MTLVASIKRSTNVTNYGPFPGLRRSPIVRSAIVSRGSAGCSGRGLTGRYSTNSISDSFSAECTKSLEHAKFGISDVISLIKYKAVSGQVEEALGIRDGSLQRYGAFVCF